MVNISLLFAIYTFMVTDKKAVVCGKMLQIKILKI